MREGHHGAPGVAGLTRQPTYRLSFGLRRNVQGHPFCASPLFPLRSLSPPHSKWNHCVGYARTNSVMRSATVCAAFWKASASALRATRIGSPMTTW